MTETFNAHELNELNILRFTSTDMELNITEDDSPHLYRRLMSTTDMGELFTSMASVIWPDAGVDFSEGEYEITPIYEDEMGVEGTAFGSIDDLGNIDDEKGDIEPIVILMPEEDLMTINSLKILKENVYEALKFLEENKHTNNLGAKIFESEENADAMIETFVLIWNGEISAQTYESLENKN